MAIPEDGWVREKEDEKVDKYEDLVREVREMWDVRTKVILKVMGALGSVPMNVENKLKVKVIDVEISVKMIQKCAPLGSARILRKVLEM